MSPTDREDGRLGGRPLRCVIGVAGTALLLVAATGCTTARPTPMPTEDADGHSASVQGAVVPIPSTAPTSYADLGAFGRYAEILDHEFHTAPDFADWDYTADENCAVAEDGAVDLMANPSSFNGLAADSTIDSTGNESHPITGRAWAAALTTRCPQVITAKLRSEIHDDMASGLRWVAAHR